MKKQSMIIEQEEYDEDGPVPITIRLFKNRFSWRWDHFTDDKYVVSRILQYTREQLGYEPDSKMPEVEFQNVRFKKYDKNLFKNVWKGSGEWYLDTQRFQEIHGVTPEKANELLLNSFQTACTLVGDEEGMTFDFDVIRTVLE